MVNQLYRIAAPVALLLLAACDTPSPGQLDSSVRALLSGPLEVGDVEGFQGAFAEQIAADGGSAGAEYLFVVTNVSTTDGAAGPSVSVTVAGDRVSPTSVAAVEPQPDQPRFDLSPEGHDPDLHPHVLDDWAFHRQLREREERLVRERVGGLPDGGRSLLLEAAPAPPAVPAVDDIIELNVNAAQACENPILRQGRVEAVSDQAIIVADLENPEGLSRSDFEEIAQNFDQKVIPLTNRNFGEPARQIGPARTTIFYTAAVNELASGSGGLVGGFFFARDLFPTSPRDGFQGCAASNEREMFYMLTADPDGRHGQAIPADFIRTRTLTTIVHEHQHLVNASRRLWVLGTGNVELVWLNEALSHMAEELLFYQEAGLQPGMNLDLNDLRGSQARLDAVNAHQVPNLVRYMLYLEDPPDNTPIDREDGLEVRGASWSFLRYVTDQHVDDEAGFLTRLVNTSRRGTENLGGELGRDLSPLLVRWGVSHFADDLVQGLAPALRQPSWNFRSILPVLRQDETFPLTATRLQPDTPVAVSIRGGSSAFFRLGVLPEDRATITTRSGGSAPPDNVRATLVRVR